MHPLFTKKGRLVWFLCALLVAAAGFAAALRAATGIAWLEAAELAAPLTVLLGFLCLTPWYTCRTLPLAATNPLRLAVNHGAAAVAITALWVGAARGWASLLGLNVRLDAAMPLMIILGLLLFVLSVALHYTLLAIRASREAAVQTRDAELRALKAQINPHFLFNSLNSIAALAISDPPEARMMCLRLSDFLRSTLGLGERQSIAWRDEIQLVRAYLDVERVRFGSRLGVQMHMDDACADCQVPPLLLQPLIENAVKHGVASMVEGSTIRVESRLRDGNLEVRVQNDFDPESPSQRQHGLGLRNVRARLETRYRGQARFSARAERNVFCTEMSMPCVKSD